jgi:DNA replication licensing factor MCM4
MFAYDDLVDTLRPGDRVEVTGIFRAVPRRLNPKFRAVKNIYKVTLC